MSYDKDEDCIMYLNLPYFKNTSKTLTQSFLFQNMYIALKQKTNLWNSFSVLSQKQKNT